MSSLASVASREEDCSAGFCDRFVKSLRFFFSTGAIAHLSSHPARHTFAMHQAFYIEELVRRIAFNADDGSSGSTSLLALACCCKALESPVMDVLWQRQKHLHIILQTLPADCWTISYGEYVSGDIPTIQVTHFPLFQDFARAPRTVEWQRFKGYVARIVELVVGEHSSRRVSSEAITFFGMQSIVDPLLPRLTSLRLEHRYGWRDVPFVLAFLSPKITALTLALPARDDVLFQPILSVTSDRCRWLQELVLDVDFLGEHPANVVEELIIACRDTLRTLEIRSSFKVDYFPVIANLPQLRSLRMERIQIPRDLPSGFFPSLEEFTILRFDGGPLQHFFKRIRTIGLKVVKIHTFRILPFRESMEALSRFSASLEVMEISGVANIDLPSVVVPRLLFTNLTTLRVECLGSAGSAIHFGCVFRPTDKSIAELGEAMPNIVHLTLGSQTCSGIKCVTFLSLVSLSKTCQDLETLSIRVDFQSMVAPSPRGSGDAETGATFDGTQGSACGLRKLVVGLSTLPDHPDSGWLVAIGLGKIFPSLSEVVGSEQDAWEKVGRNIRMSR